MMTSLSVHGDITRGQDIRNQNAMAAQAIANIVKSSLGPVGLDKMLVDEVGDVIITNDGATILKQLEVEHPAGKILVELSHMQDKEVGDGTTSVVILAAELLKQANELVKAHVHPTSVIAGLNAAKKAACAYIKDELSQTVESLGKDTLINAATTSMSSKIIGQEGTFFAQMAVDAVSRVKTIDASGKAKYPVSAVTILKSHGKSARESQLVDGYALNSSRASQAMPTEVRKAKIALLDIDLRKTKLPMGVQVLVNDPVKLARIREAEGDITKARIQLMLNAGANVVLTTKGIDDMAMKLFVEAGAIAVRRVAKADLRQIAKCCGGVVLTSLADADQVDFNEVFDASSLGEAELVAEERVGDGELLFFRGCANQRAQTLILRGANDFMLDEIDRSLHDSMMVVKRVLESKAVVPGGGAVEVALSVYLEKLAGSMASREQLAISAFAQALLIIPKTLAVNGAFDAVDLVARMRAMHNESQTNPAQAALRWTGLDLEEGKLRDCVATGVLEPAISKIKMIRFATEAAVTLLRIDDSIKMKPRGDPQGPVHDDY